MKDQNIAQKLLTGFHNVDRMQRETNELLNSLMGLIRQGELRSAASKWEYSETFASEDDKYRWMMSCNVYDHDEERTRIMIECSAEIPNTNGRYKCVVARQGQKIWFGSGTEGILDAYNALPILVNGLLDKFPFMKERCKPFFQAAEVTFG